MESAISVNNDIGAIERAVGRERGRLLEFIKSRVRIPEDSEDILQDVFLSLVDGAGFIGPLENLTSWLFTVARHRIIDRYRKRRPESIASVGASLPEDGAASSLTLDIIADSSPLPDDLLFSATLWEEIEEAIEELPDAQREVFVMHEIDGMSFKEISSETGIGVPTLLSRKRYATAFLRSRLQTFYDELNS